MIILTGMTDIRCGEETCEKALGMSQVTTTEQHKRFGSKTPSFNELFGLSGTKSVEPTLGNFVSWLVANRLANTGDTLLGQLRNR